MDLILLGIILAIMLTIIVIFWVLFSRKKGKSNADFNANAIDEETVNTSNKKLRILIFRHIGDDLVTQVGAPIIAEETKDENNNLIILNEPAKFKEDFNFSVDRIYEMISYSLKLQSKSVKEKGEILRKTIKEQEDLLNKIDIDIRLNTQYNYQDEELKLKQLRIFYDSLLREQHGNYMRLTQGGVRQYEFVAIDGILYPYFFGSKKFRVYPDLTIKKKIFNSENTIYNAENTLLQAGLINWIVVIMLAIGVVLTLGNGFWTYKNMTTGNSMSEVANKGALQCSQTLSELQRTYGDIIKEYMESKRLEKIETDKNKQNPNINNPPPSIPIIGGNIN